MRALAKNRVWILLAIILVSAFAGLTLLRNIPLQDGISGDFISEIGDGKEPPEGIIIDRLREVKLDGEDEESTTGDGEDEEENETEVDGSTNKYMFGGGSGGNGGSDIQEEFMESLQEKGEENVKALIKAKDEKGLERISEMVENKGGEVQGKYKIGKVIVAFMPADRVEEIQEDENVEGVWPNMVYHVALEESVPQINAPYMWGLGYNGSGISIAILDTGIDKNHLMLQEKVVLENDFTGSGSAMDGHGHGTHCAGIAAGKKSGSQGYNGVAPGALLINAKVINSSGQGTDEWIINGINWAVDPDGDPETDDGADIISMSLGAPYANLNSPLVSAVREAINEGVVVVVAAGNCGPGCPSANCYGYIGVETPGVTPEAITVGAVDKSNYWACFSSGGFFYYNNETIIKPDVVAPGVDIISSVPGGYASSSGTSMSTPHVAGAAALLLQVNQNITPEDAKYLMEKTAFRLGDPGKDLKYGSGLIDAGKFFPVNVNKLLNYRLDIPEFVYRYEIVDIVLSPVLGNVMRANLTVTDPSDNEYHLNFTEVNSNWWETDFDHTQILGVYDVKVQIMNNYGEITELEESFDVVKHNLTEGAIKDIVIPETIGFNETLPIAVVFENIGNQTLDVLVDCQIYEDDSLIESIKLSKNVSSGSNETFNFTWRAESPLGMKTVKAIAVYDDEFDIMQEDFEVVDNSPPVIESVVFAAFLKENDPALVEITVKDVGNLSGNVTFTNPSSSQEVIDLVKLSEINYVKTFAVTYKNTLETGQYSFEADVCDQAGYCANSGVYNFQVSGCSDPSILLVFEQNESGYYEIYSDPLASDYCLSVWYEHKSGVPDLEYLQRFGGVIWSTGNYFGSNVDEESASLLTEYMEAGGNLVLEGPDIASEHGYDDFMENVTHSVLDEDLLFEENESVSIIKTRNHPIFKNLSSEWVFNVSICPYPDSIVPLEAEELAEWNASGFAIVGWNDGVSKSIFLPFSISALEGSLRYTLVRNLAEWLVTGWDNADLVIDRINNEYPLIEGVNMFQTTVENTGSEDVSNTKVDLYVDDTLENTQHSVDVNAGGEAIVTSVFSIENGTREIKAEVNSDFLIAENNYLNNLYSKTVYVSTQEADLLPKSVSYEMTGDNVNITAEIENIGGTNAQNVPVEFWINWSLFTTEYADVDYGGTKEVSVIWPKEYGVFDLEVKVNPNYSVTESVYSNNDLSSEIYVCSRESILIVSDNDASGSSTDNPSSVEDFETVLENHGYCFEVWDEKEEGVPGLSYLNQFDVVVWTSGDYWNTVLDEDDVDLLKQYEGKILFEGSDIAFEHKNDSLMTDVLHTLLDKDMIILNETEILPSSHEIFENVTGSILLDPAYSQYPDSLTPNGSECVANWTNASCAVVVYEDGNDKIVYFGLSADGLNEDAKDTMIYNSIEWLLGELCENGETKPCTLQEGVCDGSYETCTDNRWPGCNSSNYGQDYEGDEVTCDGLDNDCDSVVDEGGNSLCDDGLFCNGEETCDAVNGCQAGTPVDCSANDISGIATCDNDPDNNSYTWDYREAFTSVCDEPEDTCTQGEIGINHTCNKTQCNAECEEDGDCDATDCDNLDGCYSGTYRDYDDVANDCLGDCSCESNACSDYTEIITDNDNDGYDTECDGDCNDNNASIHPGATEVCNGLDDDCDDQTDDGGDSLCDDGLYCNGQETCGGVSGCQGGTAPDCSDGVSCTDDSCDEVNDQCVNMVNDANCNDGLWCNGVETCDSVNDCQTGTPVDCSANDLPEIGTCDNDPDNNPYTWDYFGGFTSECNEENDECTTGSYSFTHACNVTGCGAECEWECPDANRDGIVNDTDLEIVGENYGREDCAEPDWCNGADFDMNGVVDIFDLARAGVWYGRTCVVCPETDCDYLDGCVGKDYYDYGNIPNFCHLYCECAENPCGEPTIYYNDSRCECQMDDDCSWMDDDYCEGDMIKHDEGKCVNYECTTETTTMQDCNDLDNDYCEGIEIKHDDYTCESAVCVVSSTTVVEDCSDGIECTDDVCNENLVQCDNPNLDAGTSCGLARDCPESGCNGYFAEFYPPDGHDSCDGSGNCAVYSCAMTDSYCTDNDPYDWVNSLECGAPCDQDSDCNPYCVGDFRYYSGICPDECTCSYSSEDCNDYDTDNCWCTTGNTLSELCDDWNCGNGVCKDSGSDWTMNSCSCDGGIECNQQGCRGTDYICYRTNGGSWNWAASAESAEENCDDGYDNDCDGLTDALDPDCPAPDLRITNFWVSPENPVAGEYIVIQFVLKNIGNEAADEVYWEIDTNSSNPNPSSSEPVTLGVNDELVVGAKYRYYSEGTYNVRLIADPDDVVEEKNEDNNVLYINVTVINPDRETEDTEDPTPDHEDPIEV